jgi:hypothetical protein
VAGKGADPGSWSVWNGVVVLHVCGVQIARHPLAKKRRTRKENKVGEKEDRKKTKKEKRNTKKRRDKGIRLLRIKI